MSFYLFFTGLGISFYAYGVLFKSLVDEFSESSRLSVSAAMPIMHAVYMCVAPMVGHVLHRASLRKLLTYGALVMAVGFVALSQTTTLWQSNLIYGVAMGFALALNGPVTISTLLSQWFVRRRGTAMGIAACGAATMGIFAPFIAGWTINEYGWRTLCLAYGICIALLVIPAIRFLVIDRPEILGIAPDNRKLLTEPDRETKRATLERAAPERELTYSHLLRQPNLWFYAVSMAIGFGVSTVIITQAYTQTADLGFSVGRAGWVTSALAAMIFVGKLVNGWLADHVSKRTVLVIVFGAQALGTLLQAQGSSYEIFLLAVIIFGFGFGGQAALYPALPAMLFGRYAVGRVLGMIEVPVYLTVLSSVPFATWMFDVTGSYTIAYRYFLGLYMVALVAILLLRIKGGEASLGSAGPKLNPGI